MTTGGLRQASRSTEVQTLEMRCNYDRKTEGEIGYLFLVCLDPLS